MRNSGAAFWQCGASLLELSVAMVVISILAATMLQRLFHVQEYAEKVAMESMISRFRSALRVRVGELLIADRAAEIETLAGANPVDWLENRPGNYLGTLSGKAGAGAEGQWYFDAVNRELVYTANSRRYFVSPTDSDYTVRLKVLPILNANEDISQGQPVWVRLAVTSDYIWF
jgi:prepilin-type N-terminal cleavage/methylation domain-containing protein